MDRDRDNGKDIDITEPEELLVIVKKIKAVPKIKPSRSFRMRMAFYSLFPGLSLLNSAGAVKPKKTESSGGRLPNVHRLPALRYTTAAAFMLLIALLVFSGLTFAARNSNPGDSLYSLKRVREGLELAFTFDQSEKMEKTLSFAERRLDELDFMLENDRLDSDGIKAVIEDYRSKTSTVAGALQAGKLAGAGNIESQYSALITAENNIEKRLAAAGPVGTLKPAGEAVVTVKDTQGGLHFENGAGSIPGVTDSKGRFSFSAVVDDPEKVSNMDVLIEADGKTAVVPAFTPVRSVKCGQFEAGIDPTPGTLELGQSEAFTLTLAREGRAAHDTMLRLSDSSGTSSINSRGSTVSLKTDESGAVSFEVTKTSVEQVSRISLDILDNGWNPMGEILAIGGVDASGAGNKTSGTVKAQNTKSPDGSENIVLENGLLRVSVNGGSGDVITAISRNGETSCGPVSDPCLSAGNGTAVSGCKVKGPVLTFAKPDSASYEITYEISKENCTLTKKYSVTLNKNREFATVDCVVQTDGTAGDLREQASDLYRLEFGRNSQVSISGKEIKAPGDENPTIVDFKLSEPYSTVESTGGVSFISCTAGSPGCPDTWVLGNNFLNMRLDPACFRNGSAVKVSALVSAAGPEDTRKLEQESKKNGGLAIDMMQVIGGSGNGFVVRTRPECADIRKGRQNFTITVYKEYEKLFD
ncbi:MAG: hypothetical protein JW738_08880 [Actinobacteria bacterium]|nr:hypothetical protein [Actinomycetota bacterium]